MVIASNADSFPTIFVSWNNSVSSELCFQFPQILRRMGPTGIQMTVWGSKSWPRTMPSCPWYETLSGRTLAPPFSSCSWSTLQTQIMTFISTKFLSKKAEPFTWILPKSKTHKVRRTKSMLYYVVNICYVVSIYICHIICYIYVTCSINIGWPKWNLPKYIARKICFRKWPD